MDQFYFCPPLLQQALKEVSATHKDDDKNQKRKSDGADDRIPTKILLDARTTPMIHGKQNH